MRGWLRGGWKDWLWLIAAAALFLSALFVPLSAALADTLNDEEIRLLNAFENGEIIRLHVIAHSDSPYDQSVKLAVRDAILDAFGPVLANASAHSFQTACEFLTRNLSLFETVAKASASEMGFQGTVQAEAGMLELPERTYGHVTLPKGEYQALRITLGSGEGRNWWCVLFPQLCLKIAQEPIQPALSPVWHSRQILSNWLLYHP